MITSERKGRASVKPTGGKPCQVVGRTCVVVGATAESQATGAIEESFKRNTWTLNVAFIKKKKNPGWAEK